MGTARKAWTKDRQNMGGKPPNPAPGSGSVVGVKDLDGSDPPSSLTDPPPPSGSMLYWMDVWLVGCMDGWMVAWMDGLMDGCMVYG